MNIDLSQMTPLLAIIVVGLLAFLDLLLGVLGALRSGVSIQKLPNWLDTTIKPYVLPLLAAWLVQHQQSGGTFNATALSVGIYGGCVTLAPKLSQDILQKALGIVTSFATPAAPSAPPPNAPAAIA